MTELRRGITAREFIRALQHDGFELARVRGSHRIYRQMAQLVERQTSTISIRLTKLRNADVVRYDTAGKETRYWLKHKSEMKGLLKMLGRVVDASVKVK